MRNGRAPWAFRKSGTCYLLRFKVLQTAKTPQIHWSNTKAQGNTIVSPHAGDRGICSKRVLAFTNLKPGLDETFRFKSFSTHMTHGDLHTATQRPFGLSQLSCNRDQSTHRTLMLRVCTFLANNEFVESGFVTDLQKWTIWCNIFNCKFLERCVCRDFKQLPSQKINDVEMSTLTHEAGCDLLTQQWKSWQATNELSKPRQVFASRVANSNLSVIVSSHGRPFQSFSRKDGTGFTRTCWNCAFAGWYLLSNTFRKQDSALKHFDWDLLNELYLWLCKKIVPLVLLHRSRAHKQNAHRKVSWTNRESIVTRIWRTRAFLDSIVPILSISCRIFGSLGGWQWVWHSCPLGSRRGVSRRRRVGNHLWWHLGRQCCYVSNDEPIWSQSAAMSGEAEAVWSQSARFAPFYINCAYSQANLLMQKERTSLTRNTGKWFQFSIAAWCAASSATLRDAPTPTRTLARVTRRNWSRSTRSTARVMKTTWLSVAPSRGARMTVNTMKTLQSFATVISTDSLEMSAPQNELPPLGSIREILTGSQNSFTPELCDKNFIGNGSLFCTAVDVRLVNEDCEEGEEVTSGRVEVSRDGGATWGTVCDDYWDDNDATWATAERAVTNPCVTW